jgi:hypothetical protein
VAKGAEPPTTRNAVESWLPSPILLPTEEISDRLRAHLAQTCWDAEFFI